MWRWRRKLRILWMNKLSSDTTILERVDTGFSLIGLIVQNCSRWFGHVLGCDVMVVKVEGKGQRGRQQSLRIDGV